MASPVASGASPTVKWPLVVTGHLITSSVGSMPKALAFGTRITPEELKLARTEYQWVASFVGDTGYSLIYINRLEYPIVTQDDGVTWRIDSSSYWTNGGADAGAGAIYVDASTPTVVTAYGNQFVYSTDDGGHHWYLTDGLGDVEAIAPSSIEWWVPRLPSDGVIADVSRNGTYKDANRVVGRAQYVTANGGRTWQLMPGFS